MHVTTALPFALTLLAWAPSAAADAEHDFEALTGAELVWSRDDLPSEVLFDRTPELAVARRDAAATILLAEARKYPPGYFERIGLERIGVFQACISDTGDGFRAFDKNLDGYRYYGQWAPVAGHGAVIAAFYSDGQLPQTFHHEVFHHIDATVKGDVDHGHFTADDARFASAIAGSKPYAGANIDAAIVKSLSRLASDEQLDDSNGAYAAKSAGEDQAEAARWFMTNLPEGLLQIARHPELGGSQRLLHLLTQYSGATRGGVAADLAWFVDLALGKTHASAAAADPDATRDWLEAEAKKARSGRASASPERVASATIALTRERILPRDNDTRFTVWTPTQFQGGTNEVLQADIARIGADAVRLAAWSGSPATTQKTLRAAQDALLTLLVGYRTFIAGHWDLSDATTRSFDDAERAIRGALLGPRPARVRDNPYLDNVDAALEDLAWRATIREVQPATVKIGLGSGVNLDARGLILTNAHVAKKVGDVLAVTFPDGSRYRGTTIASDHHADLAIVRLAKAGEAATDDDAELDLPFAAVARKAPKVGDDVVVIGQPGKTSPDGEPTGYEGWHVSVGKIRGFRDDIYGDQSLGRTKHSAWTYWGHSGSPLLNRQGAVAALHNSWDSKTAMRHAVPHEVIVRFLDAHDVSYTRR